MQLKLLDMPRVEFVANLARPAPPSDYIPPSDFPDIHAAKRITIDVESYDPEIQQKGPGWRRDARVVGVGVNADNKFRRYFPLKHIYGPNSDPSKVWPWLKENLERFKGELCGANVNLYDGDALQVNDVRPRLCKWHDIEWAEPLLDESALSYGLPALANKYLGATKQTTLLDEKYGPNWIQAVREVHPAHLEAYVLGDVDLPGAILDKQLLALKKENLLELYDLESRLCPMLLYMRELGVRVDLQKSEKLSVHLLDEIKRVSKLIEEMVGFPVNFRPSQSLTDAFDLLKIQYPLTEKGNPSITNDFLKRVEHPFAKLVMEAREYDKIQGTFIQGYILDDNIKGRIHAEFNPLRRANEEGNRGTVSGRLSCTNPNLQNIPVRTELGKQIRELFVPEPDWNWWSKDYSQIEFRLLVHVAVLTGCKGADIAQKMYRDDPKTDFHMMVSELTGLARKPAKNLNFGLVYGMGKAKLARTLGVDDIAAEEIMNTYHTRAPFIKELFNKAMNTAQERGYVKTLLNRRSRFNEMEPKWRGEGTQRARTHKALNCILQGSSADMMKKAMIDIWEAGIIYKNGPLHLHLSVHDELDGSVEPGPYGDEALDEVNHIMENAIPLEVPVLTEGGVGPNWGAAH